MPFHLLLLQLALLAQLALCGNWNTGVKGLVTERLDPIINPNGVASHMHAVIGGSSFGASYNFDEATKSACTSFPISVDKSNYWLPKMYWINQAGKSFTPIPQGHRVYYFRSKSSPNSSIQAFPEGLRMLAGDPNNKSPNTKAFYFLCRVDDKFNGPLDVSLDNFNMPRDCPKGLLIQAKFPSCWNGVDLYKADQSHMSYPASGGATWGSCPWSHPIRLPSIMVEYYFQTSKWAPGEPLAGKLAWANGDTTGYGVHADFTNGWDTKILQKALDDPVCGSDADMTFQECPVFQPFINDANCAPQKGVLTEPGGHFDLVPIPALPGCNPLWGTGPKPTNCSAQPVMNLTSFIGVNGNLTAATPQVSSLPTIPGWTTLGCIADGSNMLANYTRYNDPNVTQSTCLDSCLRNGYKYGAIGKMWGTTWDCHCGTGVTTNAQFYPNMCNLTCPGNSSQACGGSGAHQVFFAPNGTITKGDYTADMGCYQDPPAGNASLYTQASYNFTSWSLMTPKLCLQACADRGLSWGAVRNGAQCFCGSNLDLGKGNWVSGNTCTSKCTGNATETCGFWNGASVWNVTTTGYKEDKPVKPPGYLYCFSGGNTSLTGTQYYDGQLTPQRCVAGCAELKYSLAAVWNTNMCMCGNSYNGQGVLPNSMCSGKCPGNSTTPLAGNAPLTCGAQWNIGELYNTSVVASSGNSSSGSNSSSSSNPSRPAGWQGCYKNDDSSLLKDYTVSDGKMTVEKCLSSCDELGFQYAGVQSNSQCRCGNTAPAIAPIASNVYCNIACLGNANQTCGGWSKLEVYKITPSNKPGGTGGTGVALPGYQGCFNGTTGLKSYSWTNWNNMTVEACTKGCKELGYPLSSLYYATCSCGDTWSGGVQLSSISCSNNCTGNASEKCGGWPSQSSVYSTSVGASTETLPLYHGCFNDSSASRALTGYSAYLKPGLSVSGCRSMCSAKGYLLAGVENGEWCFCGNALLSTSIRQTSSFCSTPCPANAAQTCGGWNYMGVYQADDSGNGALPRLDVSTNKTYTSAYLSSSTSSLSSSMTSSVKPTSSALNSTSSQISKSAMSNSSSVVSSSSSAPDSSSSVSVSKSSSVSVSSTSSSSASPLASAKVASPSSFGSSASSSVPASSSSPKSSSSSTTSSTSSAASASSSSASARAARVSAPESSSSSGRAIPSSSSSSSSSSVAPTVSDPAKAEGYQGCYNAGQFVASAQNTTTGSAMTIETCRRFCRLVGTPVAGLTAGNKCACGAMTRGVLGTVASDRSCLAKCAGDNTRFCGSTDSSFVSLFFTTGSGAEAPQDKPKEYIGCFAEQTSPSPKLLPGYTTTSDRMTTSACYETCLSRGYAVYGTQGGTGCFCATSLPALGVAAESECSTKCSGDSGICGGNMRLSVYGVKPEDVKKVAQVQSSSSAPASSAAASSAPPTVQSSAATVAPTSATPSSQAVIASSSSSASVTIKARQVRYMRA